VNEDHEAKSNIRKRPASLNAAGEKASAGKESAKHTGEEKRRPRTRRSSESAGARQDK
jgi:hypothetical protein